MSRPSMMKRRKWGGAFVVAAVLGLMNWSGCGEGASLSQEAAETRGDSPQGKGDAPEGTCVGFCGQQAEGGCWCDEQCVTFGDCCADKKTVCDGGASSTAADPVVPSCPDWQCTDADCDELVPMPGTYSATDAKAAGDAYYISTASKYAYMRKDLTKALVWATCETALAVPGTEPLAFGDISQSDGKTPGTDVGQPRHPTSTHTGRDIDIAYYQTDGQNDLQIVCGDGSDNNSNGYAGTYNDGYFCTTSDSVVDWQRTCLLFAKLFELGKARVFGIDEALSGEMLKAANELLDDGLITAEIYQQFESRVSWGNAGGWAFHHHHSHLSFN